MGFFLGVFFAPSRLGPVGRLLGQCELLFFGGGTLLGFPAARALSAIAPFVGFVGEHSDDYVQG